MRDTKKALHAVAQERIRQNVKWGDQKHAPAVWLSLLTEEVGELAKEVNEDLFGDKTAIERMRTEAIQTAAVAIAFIEQLDEQTTINQKKS
jgi:NTP pyrophosphatase (non-canonical NTP hydrolase)